VERLEKAWDSWQGFIPDREEARSQAMGKVDLEKKRRLADLKVELAQTRAKIAMLQAEIGQEKVSYVKGAFDAQWSVEKAERRQELEEAISEQINVHGKTGYQLANHLGTKNINMFYEVKRQGDVYRGEQSKEVSTLDWKWSRFTGTQRYALSTNPNTDSEEWAYVLMKGTLDTDLEHKECVWDYKTGAYVSGDKKVFESDNGGNRRQRATRLAQVLEGTYAGKVKESPNPYFEETE
jgi:hypothetical protein